jgi:hypothetical protein
MAVNWRETAKEVSLAIAAAPFGGCCECEWKDCWQRTKIQVRQMDGCAACISRACGLWCVASHE